jgi:hypothetical protein
MMIFGPTTTESMAGDRSQTRHRGRRWQWPVGSSVVLALVTLVGKYAMMRGGRQDVYTSPAADCAESRGTRIA